MVIDRKDQTRLIEVRAKIVEEQGHDVITASSGEEGVEAATANKPDLILMDVVMPGLNGFQATRKISKNKDTADIPIIFVTTKNQETDRIWGLRQGASAYLTKPVDKKQLINAVNEALGG